MKSMIEIYDFYWLKFLILNDEFKSLCIAEHFRVNFPA